MPAPAHSTNLDRADLDRLVAIGEEPVPVDRFRPTLVVSSCPAFAEDTWSRLRIGAITFRSGGPCARCIVTTTHQFSGERGHDPLRTLATYRRAPPDPSRINLDLNLTHETKSGTLRVDDAVELLKYEAPPEAPLRVCTQRFRFAAIARSSTVVSLYLPRPTASLAKIRSSTEII